MSEEPNFEGVPGSSCEHHTVGPHRAWCHTCQEWCYPSAPCARCKAVPPVDWPARFRAAAEVVNNRQPAFVTAMHFGDIADRLESGLLTPDVVAAIGRALLGEEAGR